MPAELTQRVIRLLQPRSGGGLAQPPRRLMAVLRMGSQPLSSFEFLLPQGRVLLCTTPVSYEAAARLIDAGPGTNDVLLLLKKRP